MAQWLFAIPLSIFSSGILADFTWKYFGIYMAFTAGVLVKLMRNI